MTNQACHKVLYAVSSRLRSRLHTTLTVRTLYRPNSQQLFINERTTLSLYAAAAQTVGISKAFGLNQCGRGEAVLG